LRPRAIVASDDSTAGQLQAAADEQATADLAGIPLIVCPLPSSAQPALAMGAHGYLAKPVTMQGLLEMLSQAAPQARTVLVVDDDPRVVRLLSRMLLATPGRYKVRRAFDGREALALMHRQPPDVVLLDLYMPEMDGFAVLHHMRQDPGLAQIPVVAVSAKGLPADGILRLRGLIAVNRPVGLSLVEMLRYLQALLDASGPPAMVQLPSDQRSGATLSD
jgi:CheY-like chemotaxis protein